MNKTLSMAALAWKLGGDVLVGVGAAFSLAALIVLKSGIEPAAFSTAQLQTAASMLLEARMAVYTVIFTFLGVGSTIYCYLFFKSKLVPGRLAIFGMVSYSLLVVYSFLKILLPEIASTTVAQIVLYTPSCVFEPVMGVWLFAASSKLKAIPAE
jgi:hypothetical protein